MSTGDAKALVIGIGNLMRGDDGAGPAVARLLWAMLPPDIDVIEHTGEGTSLMDLWRGVERVILIDATRSGSAPGTIHRVDVIDGPLPTSLFPCSTHGFGVAEAVKMARALHELPPQFVIYGIEAEQFAEGSGLSASLSAAIEAVAEQIVRDVAPCDNQAIARPCSSDG